MSLNFGKRYTVQTTSLSVITTSRQKNWFRSQAGVKKYATKHTEPRPLSAKLTTTDIVLGQNCLWFLRIKVEHLWVLF